MSIFNKHSLKFVLGFILIIFKLDKLGDYQKLAIKI